ncbi:MAG: SpoIIE family protein phosphatase [Planctomycetota bacterium]|jgi:sigma-B regulation protein RsbU (phosphoserine phosphatase)
MKIRHKLLVLLLLVSLVPVLITVVLTRLSIKRLSAQISRDIQAKQFQDVVEGVTVHVHNYREAILGSNNSLVLALQLQANEVEKRLSESSMTPPHPLGADRPFGLDEKLALPDERRQTQHPFSNELNFQAQQVFIPQGAAADQPQDLACLWTMTGVYHQLYESNRGKTLWHYTALHNGVLATYPARGSVHLPEDYDPRDRSWYQLAKNSPQGQVVAAITVDATAAKVVLTVAKPVYSPEGKFAGVTAIDRQMNDYFNTLKIPVPLQEKAGFYLVGLGRPEEPVSDELVIFWNNQANKDDIQNRTDWRQTPDLPSLVSSDRVLFNQMIDDIKTDQSGVKTMEYNGKNAIWAYSGRIGRKAALVMIIPFDVVLELAQQTQTALIDENIKQARRAGLLVLAVVVIAAFLAYILAGKFTRPINNLATAANQLSEGDYSARTEIHSGDELQRLAEVFNEVGPRLKEHEKTQRSLALARAIQQNLLPQRAPEIDGFQIAGRCRYCDETGGDYFDFIHLPGTEKQKVGIVLGDVTGHGVGAALLMASARSILRNASQHFTGDLATLMSQFNDQLSEDTGEDKFMTLFYGVLDDETRSLTWASGGHDPALWYHRKADAFEELPNTGPLTGYMKDMPYEQAGPVTLETDDVLLVGTDGIWEAENPDAEPYGKERLHELIQMYKDRSAQQIVDVVVESVEDFCAPVAPADDVTLIVIKAI